MGDSSPYQPSDKPYFGITFLWILAFHILAVLGFILFPVTWPLFFLFLAKFTLQSLGVTIGYHRMLTHRSVKFKFRWIERLWVFLGCSAGQSGPIWWCSLHRYHHQYSDTPQDPHNSEVGFIFSHIAWLFFLDPRWNRVGDVQKYKHKVQDIYDDPFYLWLDRYYFVPIVLFISLFYLVGGWAWVFWGGVIPIAINFHATWTVNSLSHFFGYETFHTRPITDQSKNNWFVALIAFGEGWHNNHHAFPSSSKQGFFKWWEIDLSYGVLKIFKMLGLVEKLVLPKQNQIEAQRINEEPIFFKNRTKERLSGISN